MKKVPPHIVALYGTARRFKQDKRRQLDVIRRAIGNIRFGCAFLPNGSQAVQDMTALSNQLKLELSSKTWGR